MIDPKTGKKISEEKIITIFPANLFVTGKDVIHTAIKEIQDDLVDRLEQFKMIADFGGQTTKRTLGIRP